MANSKAKYKVKIRYLGSTADVSFSSFEKDINSYLENHPDEIFVNVVMQENGRHPMYFMITKYKNK